jgi:hypothetical protein
MFSGQMLLASLSQKFWFGGAISKAGISTPFRGTVKDQVVDANVYTGDGLRPKILRGNRFYKGHRDIAGKASHHFKKVSISLKMYLKNLANP